jgi:adenylate cyclase
MAYFCDAEQCSDHAHRAVNCAVEMQIAMNQVNNDNEADGLPSLYMGIGINTGIVTMGHMGSYAHNKYTLIGDGVNLATSVGSHSLRGQVLISDYTYQQVKDVVEIGDINEAHIKGKNEMVKLYEITVSHWQEKMAVPMREIRSSVRVNVDMEFPFQIIENNEVQPGILFAQARDISYKGVYAITRQPLDVLTEIKLSLSLSLLGDETREVYGKVKSIKETDDGYGCGIEFDDLDIDSIEAVKNYIHRIIEGS